MRKWKNYGRKRKGTTEAGEGLGIYKMKKQHGLYVILTLYFLHALSLFHM